MEQPSGRAAQADGEVMGNIVWLDHPARGRKRPSTDPIVSLKRSVAELRLRINQSRKLRTDIAAEVSARRYELYRGSMASGAQAVERCLAAAQGVHLKSVLRFVHAVLAARSNDMAIESAQRSHFDSLVAGFRELGESVKRAQRLSRDMRVQAECRDWAAVLAANMSRRHRTPPARRS